MNPLQPSDWEAIEPFALREADKRAFLLPRLDRLTRHHYSASAPFREIVDRVFGGLRPEPYTRLEDLPFLPVSLFKERQLQSIPAEAVFKVLTSSGTTGQRVSRVVLDRDTAQSQAHALVRIVQHFIGRDRLPMVILDHPNVVRDRASFSARGAGILGMMQFGRAPFYALRDDMTLDREGLADYLAKQGRRPVLFFGFTFMAWRYGVLPLVQANTRLAANGGVLVHSGGWKKLESERVSPEEFSETAKRVLGVQRVLNFYGMVEQVGSVFFENQLGRLQAPVFADVIVRDPDTLEPLPPGSTGLLQVFSILPRSYPGHSLLTADVGRVVGCDHPDAGGFGRYFEVLGRAHRAEVRGCSDTYAQN